MDLGLKGKVALVTAASKGMGKACALGLAAEGARVAIARATRPISRRRPRRCARRPGPRCWRCRPT